VMSMGLQEVSAGARRDDVRQRVAPGGKAQ
jgi:hypothetical protein